MVNTPYQGYEKLFGSERKPFANAFPRRSARTPRAKELPKTLADATDDRTSRVGLLLLEEHNS
jgi:hypothetical protein